MRRGELYRYVRPSTPTTPRTVLVLSGLGVNRSPRPWLLGVELRHEDPEDLLAVPVGDGRYACAGDLTRLYRAWVGAPEGRVDRTTLNRVEDAVRAALDL